MLKIEDIPQSYKLFGRVMNLHIKQFWHREPEWKRVGLQDVAYIRSPIDTTFAVHRAGEPFRRLKSGIRVYKPFDARHLDWYREELWPEGLPQFKRYHDQSSPVIAHWNNRTYFSDYADEKLEFGDFIVVAANEKGAWSVGRHRVADNPR
jgi:hypothetical protein